MIMVRLWEVRFCRMESWCSRIKLMIVGPMSIRIWKGYENWDRVWSKTLIRTCSQYDLLSHRRVETLKACRNKREPAPRSSSQSRKERWSQYSPTWFLKRVPHQGWQSNHRRTSQVARLWRCLPSRDFLAQIKGCNRLLGPLKDRASANILRRFIEIIMIVKVQSFIQIQEKAAGNSLIATLENRRRWGSRSNAANPAAPEADRTLHLPKRPPPKPSPRTQRLNITWKRPDLLPTNKCTSNQY